MCVQRARARACVRAHAGARLVNRRHRVHFVHAHVSDSACCPTQLWRHDSPHVIAILQYIVAAAARIRPRAGVKADEVTGIEAIAESKQPSCVEGFAAAGLQYHITHLRLRRPATGQGVQRLHAGVRKTCGGGGKTSGSAREEKKTHRLSTRPANVSTDSLPLSGPGLAGTRQFLFR